MSERCSSSVGRIRQDLGQRIPRDGGGVLEAHPVLADIASRLGWIPRELEVVQPPRSVSCPGAPDPRLQGRANTGLSCEAPSLAPVSSAPTHCWAAPSLLAMLRLDFRDMEQALDQLGHRVDSDELALGDKANARTVSLVPGRIALGVLADLQVREGRERLAW